MIPNHIAIIPDGNRRWAKEHKFPVFEGHRRGAELLEKLTDEAKKMGVKIMTFWTFSTENWDRSPLEVTMLMQLFEKTLKSKLKKALKDETRIIHIGRKDRIPSSLLKVITEAEEKTKHFNKYYFVAAIDYGGRDEVLRAINAIASDTSKDSSAIKTDEKMFSECLDTKNLPFPEPDLIIRTSGEQRTSGFMIWQSVYSEYIFSDKLFPDFSVADFRAAIEEFGNRQRRFGK